MPKRVHASAFNLELVEDRPKAVLDNFVCCIGSPVAIEEEKALGIRSPRRQGCGTLAQRGSAWLGPASLWMLLKPPGSVPPACRGRKSQASWA
jgi:hypothetical protein